MPRTPDSRGTVPQTACRLRLGPAAGRRSVLLLIGILLSHTLTRGVSAVTAQTASPDVPEECPPLIEVRKSGVTLTLVAEHPQIVTPIGIDVDTEGRVWVVASHTHFRPDMYEGPEHDEILILSDTDVDGRADRREVFFDKTMATMDLELGPQGWVYLAERDRILRVKDTDRDGRGDAAEDLAVLHTTSEYPHNGLAGLVWHGSGDLIFALGENYAVDWTLTGRDGTALTGTGEGGVFRCRPDGTGLRRMARGFWNPFGVTIRDDGEMFVAENDPGSTPPCRLLHLVDGGDYGYQRRYGNAPVHPFVCWNGELRGTLPMIHATGEAPCGVAPLGGGLLVPTWADHRIDFFPLRRQGASFSTERVELVHGSDFFRPTCITQVSASEYYLSDWVFGSYELHQRGRIWKLEIDRDRADWLDPPAPDPDTPLSTLARQLRHGVHSHTEDELFTFARDDDPFVAAAALQALAPAAETWTPVDIRSRPAADRLTAVLVLKRQHPQDDDWIRVFLDDIEPDVQFETLRWISDETRTKFQHDVDEFLRRPALEYRLFEAALATRNTLAGTPAAGISDPQMLIARVLDGDAPASSRAHSLRLLDPQHKSLSLNVLRDLLHSDEPELRLESVRTLVSRSDPQGQLMLAELAEDEAQPTHMRAEALVGLPGGDPSLQELLLRLTEDSDMSVREEALRALRFADLSDDSRRRLQRSAQRFPSSADLVEAALHPQSLSAGRPAATDIAGWRERLEHMDGKADPQTGRRIFSHTKLANCITCHRREGRGGVVGPDLSLVADGSDTDKLLSSLLQPSRDVAPQYYPWKLLLDDGQVFTGIMLRKGGQSGREFYRDSNGKEQSFLKTEIVLRHELKTSLMPEGLYKVLTDRELRDLLAYIGQRTP